MKIVRAHEFGGTDRLVVDHIPAPVPGPGQVRIAVHAIGVNPADWKLLSGKAPVNPPLPLVPGGDVAGVIDALGEGVTGWRVGDRVMALLGLTGGYAEAVVTDAAHVAGIPAGLPFDQAAGLPLVGLTAWQGFGADGRDLAGLDVLVHNGAGGVGNAAIQIAHARGARVVATASAANAAALRELGADEVVDVRVDALSGQFDILLDLVGNSLETGLWTHVRRSGSVIRIAGGPTAPPLEIRDGMRAIKLRVKPDGAALAELATMAGCGILRTTIAHALPFDQAGAALELSKAGHVRGKIVLIVAQD